LAPTAVGAPIRTTEVVMAVARIMIIGFR